MKREIKFRGQRVDNKEWVEGCFGILGEDTDLEKSVITVSTLDTNSYVDRFYFTHFEVIPETVGQFTGLKDKNGVEIYEGDILQNDDKVIWHDSGFVLQNKLGKFPLWQSNIEGLKVIGNIYNDKNNETYSRQSRTIKIENIMRLRNTRTTTINANVPSFDEICEKAGFGDLKQDNRAGLNPIKRMAIWHYMYSKGVRLTDIARQSNRSHATVWSGIWKFNDYLSYGDKVSMKLSDEINAVVQENE